MMQGSLAEKLRVLRARMGLSLTEAASRAGVTRDTLSDLEHGKRHPYMPTLSKIAAGYGVPVEDLLEEPALAGKAEAPTEAGQSDKTTGEESTAHDVARGKTPRQADPDRVRAIMEQGFSAEKLPHPTQIYEVRSQTASSLRKHIEDMKELKELREAELEEIKARMGIGLRRALTIQMQLADAGLRSLLDELGVLDFAEAVKANRKMADLEVIPLCHELLRRLGELEALSAEAEATRGVTAADIHVEGKKGPSEVEAWMHKQPQEQRSPER
jgi:transcriptional regulator with XRE-family HTH domain